jgi:hypothetical protein
MDLIVRDPSAFMAQLCHNYNLRNFSLRFSRFGASKTVTKIKAIPAAVFQTEGTTLDRVEPPDKRILLTKASRDLLDLQTRGL